MVQIGWNMGARVPNDPRQRGRSTHARPTWAPQHARILGYATSFTRKLTDEAKTQQDTNLIGAMSILWALVLAYIPLDITLPVRARLEAEYPPMGTTHVPPGTKFFLLVCTVANGQTGTGYQLELDDVIVEFSTATRAPPEGIATGGYEA